MLLRGATLLVLHAAMQGWAGISAEFRERFISDLDSFDFQQDCTTADDMMTILFKMRQTLVLVSESDDLHAMIVSTAHLTRLIFDFCEDARPSIQALNRVFAYLTSDLLPVVQASVSTILAEDWTQEWSEHVRVCINRINSDLSMEDTTALISAAAGTSFPVPLLNIYLATGLFLEARDLAVELAEQFRVPTCVLSECTRGLELVDFIEPPGTFLSVESSTQELENLQTEVRLRLFSSSRTKAASEEPLEQRPRKHPFGAALDEELPRGGTGSGDSSEIFATVHKLSTTILSQSALRNRNKVLETITELEDFIREHVHHPRGGAGQSQSHSLYFAKLKRAASNIPDRGPMSPPPPHFAFVTTAEAQEEDDEDEESVEI